MLKKVTTHIKGHKKSGIRTFAIPLPWPSNLPQTGDNNDEARTIQLPNMVSIADIQNCTMGRRSLPLSRCLLVWNVRSSGSRR